MKLFDNALKKKAEQIRQEVIYRAVKNKAGHIAPSLSCVEILVALYYNVMRYRAVEPACAQRDRLIFSKAHGCYALYAILTDKGVLPKEEWEGFYTSGSLSGCVEYCLEYGFEAGCGSLGHGLPIAVGYAFGAKLQNRDYHTFCIIGDGEMQEGTTWEAIQFAVKHEIANLTIIIDDNRLQAMDFVTNILDRKANDKVKRLRGFGLSPVICNGQDAGELVRVLNLKNTASLLVPRVIIAKTVKGFGLKCMENIPKFHFRVPSSEELNRKDSSSPDVTRGPQNDNMLCGGTQDDGRKACHSESRRTRDEES